MIIPDDVAPGEERYLLKPGEDSPREDDLFLEACYLYRPDEEDRRNLSKRLKTVYDYVAHWTVNCGSPENPVGFGDTIMKDFSTLKSIKQFLKGLDERIRADSSSKINLSATPVAGDQPTTVHASQNIYIE